MSETRTRLLDAAERLFAARGIHATSAREIVSAAGQRNESAIQYHFGGRDGLIDALHARRLGEVQSVRLMLLDRIEATSERPAVGDLVRVCAGPVAERCRDDAGFRDYLRVFGQLALSPSNLLTGNRHEALSVARLGALVRASVDLPDLVIDARFDALARFLALHLCQWARSDRPFAGAPFDLFFENLMDMASAMLTAPVSEEAQLALQATEQASRRPLARRAPGV